MDTCVLVLLLLAALSAVAIVVARRTTTTATSGEGGRRETFAGNVDGVRNLASMTRAEAFEANGDIHSAGKLTADGDVAVRGFRTSHHDDSGMQASVEGDHEVSYDLKTHKDGGDVARFKKTHEGDVGLETGSGHAMTLRPEGGLTVGAKVCVGGSCLEAGHVRDIKKIAKEYMDPSERGAAVREKLDAEAEARRNSATAIRATLNDTVFNNAEYAIFLNLGEAEHTFYRDGTVYVLAMGGGASGQSRENYSGGGAGYIGHFEVAVKRGDVLKLRVGGGGQQVPYGYGGKGHAAGEASEADLNGSVVRAEGASGPDGSSGGGSSSKAGRSARDGGEGGASASGGQGMGTGEFAAALAPLSEFNPYGIRAGRKGLAETAGYYRCGGGGGGLAVGDPSIKYVSAKQHPSRWDGGAAKPGEGLGAAGAGAGFAGDKRRGGGRGAQGFVYFHYVDGK